MNTITTLLMTLTLVLPVPMVWLHLQNLWRNEYYQFAPLVLVVVAFSVFSQIFSGREERNEGSKRRQQSRSPTKYFFTSILALIAGMITFGVGVYMLSPWLGMIGYLLLLGGFMCWHVPLKRGSGWLGTWFLCWLIVPPPLGWDKSLIEQLQNWSSRLSSRFLDVLVLIT